VTPDVRMEAEAIAAELADLELRNFACRLGLVNAKKKLISAGLLRKAASCLDELSWEQDELASRLAVLIISIIWEHADENMRRQMRQRVILCLTRLGLSPTTSMIDDSYFRGDGYEPFDSIRAQLATVAMQLEYSEVVGGKEFFLTRFQSEVLSAVDSERLVGISAPTSAGKSFALYLAIARHLERNPDASVIFIVPTISLITQVSLDLRQLLHEIGFDHIEVRNSANSDVLERSISVVTQERALYALEESVWNSVGMLIVDEVQNLERVAQDDELRSKILFDAITGLADEKLIDRIVISGPRLENVGALGTTVFGVSSHEVSTTDGPVASLTYSICKRGHKAYVKQHRDVLSTSAELEIDDSGIVQGLGKLTYTDSFLKFLGGMVARVQENSQIIVFSPTSDQSVRTSLGLQQLLTNKGNGSDSLSEYIAESVHPDYSLTRLVRDGIAYHNGKVPPHARFAVETAFREGSLSKIVCTTTLMQGVNLPANIVFIRNPNLFVRARSHGEAPKLSAYEFANLRGRAGRLMKDLVGRTIVLDEESFRDDESPQDDLFSSTLKTVNAGYRVMFTQNREEVLSELAKPGVASSRSAKFIATYIRQATVRYGEAARERLASLGIGLSQGEFDQSLRLVRSIDVGPDICARNRYWDPFDLQLLKDSFEASSLKDLPSTVWEKGLSGALEEWILFHERVVPHYFHRYMGATSSGKFISAIAKSAESWAREVPLRKMIENRHFAAHELGKIDSQVALIYKHVVHSLPSLLKPLTDIRGQGSAVLAAIESGAYHPATRFLTSTGLFRETAVALRLRSMPDVGADAEGLDALVPARVRAVKHALDPWVSLQINLFTRWG